MLRAPGPDPDVQRLAEPQLRERRGHVLGQRRELDVAERVDVDGLGGEAPRADVRAWPLQAQEPTRVDGAPELLDAHAVGEMGRRRGEDVATVERARDVGQAVAGVLQEVRPGDAAQARRGRHEQAVVRAHEVVAARGLDGDALALGADARVHDRDVRADGQVRDGAPEEQGAIADGEPVDVVGEVHDDGSGADARDHGAHDARRGVAQPEVAREADEGSAPAGLGTGGRRRRDRVPIRP